MEIVTHVLTAVIAASSSCSWAHPGANPYRGDPVAVLADFAMPEETRRQLRALMVAHRYTDIATITRDDIVGGERYGDLRDMHSGRGQTCHGAVDRSEWSDQLKELGLVYCVGETCVIVPTVCNNVSLVTRLTDKPEPLAKDDGPIDISPSAGPLPPLVTPAEFAEDDGPIDISPSAGPLSPLGEPTPEEDGTPAYPHLFPPYTGGGGGSGDPQVPPVSAVPEAPVSALMFAGLALILVRARWPR